MTVTWIILIIVGYLLGSIPLSYLVGKRRGINLKQQGTMQVGAGNLWRMTSRKLGLTVGIFDFIAKDFNLLCRSKCGSAVIIYTLSYLSCEIWALIFFTICS